MKQTLHLLLVLALIAGARTASAQRGNPNTGSGRTTGRESQRTGTMYGKLLDSKTGKAVAEASVSLLQTQHGKQVLLRGAIASGNGEFSLENLPLMGQMELVISAAGYKEYRKAVAFDMAALMKAGAGMRGGAEGGMPEGTAAMLNATNRDLGNIRLEANAQALEGVRVSAGVASFRLQGEKKIFNVEQDLASQGGSAADVLKHVPGVLVDADNKVTLRNSAPQILVDGRQSPLQMDQIPADAISSIEIVSNPSAKYDAEGGSGGVLNIVLKKNRRQGYNGSVRASADSRAGGSLGGDLSARSGKVNLSFTGQSMLNRSLATANTSRSDYFTTPALQSLQEERNTSTGAFGFGWLGLDYFISNRTSISVAGMKMHASFSPEDHIDITTDSLLNSGSGSRWSSRSTSGTNTFDMNSAQLNMKHLFPMAGREWTLDASANWGRSSYDARYVTTAYETAERTGGNTAGQQQTVGSGANKLFTVQSDYTNPLSQQAKLDVGLKATVRQVDSRLSNRYYDPSEGQFVEQPNPNSDYSSTDAVYAAYGSYSGNIGANNALQLGLRMESSQYTGTLSKQDSTFRIAYPVSLFPSVFYTRKLQHDRQIQFSYRRGITRPNFFQLLPYADYTDPLNIRQGNPALRPEFTNALELSYMKNFTRSNYILVSLYERHADHLITAYKSLGSNPFTGEAVVISSYINASSSDKYGLEVTSGWDLKKWWNINANVNVYNGQLRSGAGTGSAYLSGFGKLNNQIRLAKGWSGQLSAAYQSRTNLLPDTKNPGYGGMGGSRGMLGPQASANAQGYLESQWYVDASIRKSFLKNNAASLSLSVTDIFGSRKFIQHSESDLFVQDYTRLINPTMLRLSFNWRFGKMDMDVFRRKNMKGQMEGMQDASSGMGM